MKLVGQRFRSKATYLLGRITKTSQSHIWISFNKSVEDSLRLSFDDFLKYCYSTEEVEQEVRNRIEKQRTLQPNKDNG